MRVGFPVFAGEGLPRGFVTEAPAAAMPRARIGVLEGAGRAHAELLLNPDRLVIAGRGPRVPKGRSPGVRFGLGCEPARRSLSSRCKALGGRFITAW